MNRCPIRTCRRTVREGRGKVADRGEKKMAASFTTAVRQDSNDCLSFSSNGDDCQRPVTATAAAPVCMDSVASPACEESLTENHNHQQNEEDNTLETHDGTKVEDRKSCTIRCNQCNGDVGLEVAVEAHPDLIFESDLVSSSHSSREFEHITNGYGQPRVYLERESFTSHEDIQASSSVSRDLQLSGQLNLELCFFT